MLGLPLSGALTFWSTLDARPDPNTHLGAWSRFVATDRYVITRLFGGDLALIFAIFGVFALGACLAASHAGRLGLAWGLPGVGGRGH